MPRPHSLPAHQYTQSSLMDMSEPSSIHQYQCLAFPTDTRAPVAAAPVRDPVTPSSTWGLRPSSQPRRGSMAKENSPRNPIQPMHQ